MTEKEQHKEFIVRCISEKTRLFYLSSSLRITTLQWAISSLHLLEEIALIEGLSKKVEMFLTQCQNEDGGFGANRNYPSSSVSTLSALQTLLVIKNNRLSYLKMNKDQRYKALQPSEKRAGEFTMQDRLNELVSQSAELPEEDENVSLNLESQNTSEETEEESGRKEEINRDTTTDKVEEKLNKEKPEEKLNKEKPEEKPEEKLNKEKLEEKPEEKAKEKPEEKPEEKAKEERGKEEKGKKKNNDKAKIEAKSINYFMCNAYLEQIVSDEALKPYKNEELDIKSLFHYVISKNLLSQINAGGPEYFTILDPIKKKICRYIYNCINLDGALGPEPECESHAAYTLCAVSIFFIFGQIEALDVSVCAKMLSLLQKKTGGFSARVDTSESLSASFWAYSSLSLLEKAFYVDKKALEQYILQCTSSFGGFSDKPGAPPTLLHTVSALSLLSIINNTLALEEIPYLALYLYE